MYFRAAASSVEKPREFLWSSKTSSPHNLQIPRSAPYNLQNPREFSPWSADSRDFSPQSPSSREFFPLSPGQGHWGTPSHTSCRLELLLEPSKSPRLDWAAPSSPSSPSFQLCLVQEVRASSPVEDWVIQVPFPPYQHWLNKKRTSQGCCLSWKWEWPALGTGMLWGGSSTATKITNLWGEKGAFQ